METTEPVGSKIRRVPVISAAVFCQPPFSSGGSSRSENPTVANPTKPQVAACAPHPCTPSCTPRESQRHSKYPRLRARVGTVRDDLDIPPFSISDTPGHALQSTCSEQIEELIDCDARLAQNGGQRPSGVFSMVWHDDRAAALAAEFDVAAFTAHFREADLRQCADGLSG